MQPESRAFKGDLKSVLYARTPVRSTRARFCEKVSRLWHHLFQQGHAVEHVHVLASFQRFVCKTTLASRGVNVVEQSVPPECKAQFAAMLRAQPHAPVAPTSFVSKCNRVDGTSCDNFSLPAFRVAGAQAPTMRPQEDHVSDKAHVPGMALEGDCSALESDCSALESVLARLEAAVRQQRVSPELRARFVALGSRFERMHGLMAA